MRHCMGFIRRILRETSDLLPQTMSVSYRIDSLLSESSSCHLGCLLVPRFDSVLLQRRELFLREEGLYSPALAWKDWLAWNHIGHETKTVVRVHAKLSSGHE